METEVGRTIGIKSKEEAEEDAAKSFTFERLQNNTNQPAGSTGAKRLAPLEPTTRKIRVSIMLPL